VTGGVERRPPGAGPLAMALAFGEDGAPRWIPADSSAHVPHAGLREAFQSYPVVLRRGGTVPRPLRVPGSGVDLRHRDARLGICSLRDGRLLIALTRFDALGGTLGALPFGLTTPEMAAVMGALDCEVAMLLDGGISAQLRVRDAAGRTHSWPGLRRVPLGLILVPRT
jgi:hypothetical protein